MKKSQHGFAAVAALLVLGVIAVIGSVGWYIWHLNSKDLTNVSVNEAVSSKESSQKKKKASENPGTLTNTYIVPVQANEPTIKVQYSNEWRADTQPSKAYAGSIDLKSKPHVAIRIRTIYLDGKFSAKDEWNNCPAFDACGPKEGDKKLTDRQAQINGMDVYFVKMHGTAGTYNAAVIKSAKSSSSGTLFSEFILSSDDPLAVNAFNQIIESATTG